ncbi:hypothetical protein MMC19_007745 [Ptychographa xylographoides]|nr:hypothetical protein [Ptychographa xylographoides]
MPKAEVPTLSAIEDPFVKGESPVAGRGHVPSTPTGRPFDLSSRTFQKPVKLPSPATPSRGKKNRFWGLPKVETPEPPHLKKDVGRLAESNEQLRHECSRLNKELDNLRDESARTIQAVDKIWDVMSDGGMFDLLPMIGLPPQEVEQKCTIMVERVVEILERANLV